MSDGLYEQDVLEWSEQQAALLARLARGERVNDSVDWPNVIEEMQSVGRSQLLSCTSLLRQALVHLLKLHAWPGSTAAGHWRGEISGFLFDAGRAFSPSMRQRIDLESVYRNALASARDAQDDIGTPRVLPDTCPFSLDELLVGDAGALIRKLVTTPAV